MIDYWQLTVGCQLLTCLPGAGGDPAFPAFLPFRCWRCPAGGVLCLSPAAPAFSFLSCPHPPQPPSPPGKGEIFSFFMQGASPLASPGLNPGGTGAGAHITRWRGACPAGCRLTLPFRNPQGGVPCLPPAPAAFSLPSCPHPPPPFPAGRGSPKVYFAGGYRPRHPGIRPLAALTEPAKQMPGGRLRAAPEQGRVSRAGGGLARLVAG